MIGLRCAAVYKRIRAGLLTPPVNIGIRTSTWPQHEIVYLNLALVSGKSDDDIRRLVSNMIEQRKQERNGHE
jgi:prophage regulatory protein